MATSLVGRFFGNVSWRVEVMDIVNLTGIAVVDSQRYDN